MYADHLVLEVCWNKERWVGHTTSTEETREFDGKSLGKQGDGTKEKIVPVPNYLSTVSWRLIAELRYISTILDLGTKWKRVVSFKPRPLYRRGDIPRYPLYRRLGGTQNRYGSCGVEKNIFPPAGNRTPVVQPVARSYNDWDIPTLRGLSHNIKMDLWKIYCVDVSW
jgi:hypothetical protein